MACLFWFILYLLRISVSEISSDKVLIAMLDSLRRFSLTV